MQLNKKQYRPFASRQTGVGLIEVLVAVLVLGVGLLGLAALQATALRKSQSGYERSEAVIQSYSILDAMRANRVQALAGAYNIAFSDCANGTATNLAQNDLNLWRSALQERLGDNACGRVQVNTDGITEVGVQWDDSKGGTTSGAEMQQIFTRTQL